MTVNLINPQAPTNNNQINQVEGQLNVKLPVVYREFLLHSNGGRPEPDKIEITWSPSQNRCDHRRTSLVSRFLSIHDGGKASFIEYNRDTFAGRIPADTVAIAYDAGGNLILLGVGDDNNGKIYFWVKDYEVEEGETPGYDNIGFIANSLPEFLDSLTAD